MSKRKYIDFLNDILTSSEKVITLVKNISFEDFVNNWIIIDATTRNLEVLGEASKKLPDEIKRNYPQIE